MTSLRGRAQAALSVQLKIISQLNRENTPKYLLEQARQVGITLELMIEELSGHLNIIRAQDRQIRRLRSLWLEDLLTLYLNHARKGGSAEEFLFQLRLPITFHTQFFIRQGMDEFYLSHPPPQSDTSCQKLFMYLEKEDAAQEIVSNQIDESLNATRRDIEQRIKKLECK